MRLKKEKSLLCETGAFSFLMGADQIVKRLELSEFYITVTGFLSIFLKGIFFGELVFLKVDFIGFEETFD